MQKHRWPTGCLMLFFVLAWVGVTPTGAEPPEVSTLLVLDGEASGDHFGSLIATAGDVNGDGFRDFLVSARYNDAGGDNAGRAYLYLGGPGLDVTPDLVFTGENPGDRLGSGAAGAGDVNGDGFDDFLVGARYAGGTGRAYLYFGGTVVDDVPDLVFDGEGGSFGGTMDSVGDINADGYDDFLIAAPWWGGYHGRAYVYFGGESLDNVPDKVINGPMGGEFGVQTCPGADFNGDGFSDFVVGAYKSDPGGFDSGGAWLYYGGPGMDWNADLVFAGAAYAHWFGSPIDRAGDLNGDGYSDLLIGATAPYTASPGYAYVFLGGPTMDATADLVLTGEAASDAFGSVAGIGDVNRDGFDDFSVGAYGNDDAGANAGKVYIFFSGPALDAIPDLELVGEEAGDGFGFPAGLGDVTGDTAPEFAVGAPYADAAGVDAGRVYVFSITIPCDPDPRTQGYWHRQCLGVPVADGGITPGRNSNGRGPQGAFEPDFDKLLPAVSVKLGDLLGAQNSGSCSDGMVADPPSDPCEKAAKQFTALLFNLESGRLQNACQVDLSAEGCGSTDIGALVGELAALINGGDADNCKVAADCAGAVNEGTALVLGEGLMLSAGQASGTDPVAPVSTMEAGARSVANTTSVVTQKDASAVESPSAREAGDPLIRVDLRSVERHLAVLHNSSAPERARTVSTDALLTALSGGYEPETRIEIVNGLLDEVDESLFSLLAAHLQDIRDEARDFGKEELAKEAEGLLKRLEPSDK